MARASVTGRVTIPTGPVEYAARISMQNLHEIKDDDVEDEISLTNRLSDRNWSWSYLRHQFNQRNLDGLYSIYVSRLHRSYLGSFLIIQTIITLIHILVLLNTASDDNLVTICSIYGAISIACWPILGIVTSQRVLNNVPWLPLLSSSLTLVLLVVNDLSAAVLDVRDSLVPSRGIVTLLACYIFLPIDDNAQATVLGLVVTLSYLIGLATISYDFKDNNISRIVCDVIYLLCVNCLGLFFRLMNEVFIRRTFLDRRACLETTEKLKFEKVQTETLMLSILPEHITEKMKSDMNAIFHKNNIEKDITVKASPFDDIYVEEHHNVSILYADVVNYTQMTTELPVKTLVETLNELFGRFDDASEGHDVLRIKFLGDCYYCVAGVPKPNPQHARSCVDLGLDMISIIREVRERRNLNIDMRIGVHSGSIISGVVGACKWQYDVWSRDVTIANKMESTGEPGKVHVTQQTLDLLDDQYEYEPATRIEAKMEPILVENNITTFLISPPPRVFMNGSRRLSTGIARILNNQFLRNRLSSDAMLISQRRAFMDNGLQDYLVMLRNTDKKMEQAIAQLPIGMFRQFSFKSELVPGILYFRKLGWELPFIRQADPMFKFCILTALFILLFILAAQSIVGSQWTTLLTVGVAFVIFLILIPLTWTQSIYNYLIKQKVDDSKIEVRRTNAHPLSNGYGNSTSRIKIPQDDEDEVLEIESPRSRTVRFLFRMSERVVTSICLRTLMYLVVITLLSSSAIINLVYCCPNSNEGSLCLFDVNSTSDNISLYSAGVHDCNSPWVTTQCVMLAVLMSFMMFKIHYLLKLTIGIVVTVLYSWVVWDLRKDLFKQSESWNAGLDPRLAHILGIVFLTFVMHCIDRQMEYVNRLDFLWKRRLQEEKKIASDTRMVNNMLLENILPKHVAEIYLNTNRQTDELYYEEYKSVAVMFASITDYNLINDDNLPKLSERRILCILNQIICDFDKLLFDNKNNRVEKIKMAGWTYMAACGLDPGRKDSGNILENPEERVQAKEDKLVLLMTQFAAKMMKSLTQLNRETQQEFKLRVGISHGEVTAGVVGSKKPLYDIWGHPVNMASRMDSTGVKENIQVTEETAMALIRSGIQCELRGKTKVKGMEAVGGYVTTYLVCLTKDFELKRLTPEMRESLNNNILPHLGDAQHNHVSHAPNNTTKQTTTEAEVHNRNDEGDNAVRENLALPVVEFHRPTLFRSKSSISEVQLDLEEGNSNSYNTPL